MSPENQAPNHVRRRASRVAEAIRRRAWPAPAEPINIVGLAVMDRELVPPYRDRSDAGRVLAVALGRYAGHPGTVVVALPRGGVPVAAEVARALRTPLDILIVRKLGVPGYEELAMGAVASGGVRVMNDDIVAETELPEAAIAAIAAREAAEIERLAATYRGSHAPQVLTGKTVILIDDGLATGASMRAAARAVRAQTPARVVLAAPVGASSTCAALRPEVDELLCARTPEPFYSVGYWYQDFAQTSEAEVRRLLDEAARRQA